MDENLQPLIQINCYPDITTLTRLEAPDRLCTYRIQLEDLALHLNHIQLHSGFLPSNVLAWGIEQQDERVVWYVPRGRYEIQIKQNGAVTALRIPLPAAILVGKGTTYHVFAVKRKPKTVTANLYHFPAPNVSDRGNICHGSATFPSASIANMPTAWQTFVQSAFSPHWVTQCCKSEPQNVIRLWQKLHDAQAKRFPKRELVRNNHQLASLVTP